MSWEDDYLEAVEKIASLAAQKAKGEEKCEVLRGEVDELREKLKTAETALKALKAAGEDYEIDYIVKIAGYALAVIRGEKETIDAVVHLQTEGE